MTAVYAGDANNVESASAPITVTVGTTSQTITFANPGNKTLGTPPFALTPTASSGLPVTFAATGSCTVSGFDGDAHCRGDVHGHRKPGRQRELLAGARRCADLHHRSADLANVWTMLTAPDDEDATSSTRRRASNREPLAGRVLIAGGIDRTGRPSCTSSELYNPATRTFVAAGSMPTKAVRSYRYAAPGRQGRSCLVAATPSVQMFDPTPKTWSQLSTSMSSNRTWHTATRLPDGRVLVVGGDGQLGQHAELHDRVQPGGRRHLQQRPDDGHGARTPHGDAAYEWSERGQGAGGGWPQEVGKQLRHARHLPALRRDGLHGVDGRHRFTLLARRGRPRASRKQGARHRWRERQHRPRECRALRFGNRHVGDFGDWASSRRPVAI